MTRKQDLIVSVCIVAPLLIIAFVNQSPLFMAGVLFGVLADMVHEAFDYAFEKVNRKEGNSG